MMDSIKYQIICLQSLIISVAYSLVVAAMVSVSMMWLRLLPFREELLVSCLELGNGCQ